MQGTMMDFPLTLSTVLERAPLFQDVELVSRTHRYTYGDFHRRARSLAAALLRAGLREGDRVATLMWNQHEHFEAYFGVPCAGGVLHTLNLRLHPDELAFIANHAEDRFLLLEKSLLPVWEKIRDKVKIERVIVTDEEYEGFIAAGDSGFEYPKLDENAPAAMCYTSGTTGNPKGVVYSHRALVLHSFACGLEDAFAISEQDTILPASSMFHANAWGFPYAGAMMGSKIVFPQSDLSAEALLDLFAKEQVTFSAGVPTIWLGVVDALEKNPGRWKLAPAVRIVVAGSAGPESLFRRCDKVGTHFIPPWGMTETTPVTTHNHLQTQMEDWPDDAKYAARATQGFPVPFVETRVDASPLGELQVRGPWIAGSYHNLPAAADRWTEDGWFRTGDVVAVDEHGYIKIADRTKDLIKSGGEWISSVDLENALVGHPKVREAAVIAVAHPKWAERPLALVVLRDGESATADELRGFLASKFAKWQLPEAFVFVNDLPHTSTGKLQKLAMREEYKDWKW